MDPVTAYECRHKIKEGAVCKERAAPRYDPYDWLWANDHAAYRVLLNYRQMWSDRPQTLLMLDQLAMRWEREGREHQRRREERQRRRRETIAKVASLIVMVIFVIAGTLGLAALLTHVGVI